MKSNFSLTEPTQKKTPNKQTKMLVWQIQVNEKTHVKSSIFGKMTQTLLRKKKNMGDAVLVLYGFMSTSKSTKMSMLLKCEVILWHCVITSIRQLGHRSPYICPSRLQHKVFTIPLNPINLLKSPYSFLQIPSLQPNWFK